MKSMRRKCHTRGKGFSSLVLFDAASLLQTILTGLAITNVGLSAKVERPIQITTLNASNSGGILRKGSASRRLLKLSASGRQSYLPRIYADSKFIPYYRAKASIKKGNHVPKNSQVTGKETLNELKKEEFGIRAKPLSYIPGTFSPSVKGLKSLRMDKGHMSRFKSNLGKAGSEKLLEALSGGSCAIVGNSGLLKETSFGADIDAHDVVVRLNAAPTKGFERHVGKRTTVRVINNMLGRVLVSKVPGWKEATRRQVLGEESVLWMRADLTTADKLRAALRKVGDQRAVMFLEKEFTFSSLALFREYYTTYLEMIIEQNPKDERVGDWEERLKEVKKSDPVTATVAGGHKLFGKPSTGMSMLYALKDLCSSVSLYGCGTHDAEGKPGEYKYYQPGETHTVSGNVKVSTLGSHTHSFDLEQEIELSFDREGIARFCRYKPGDSQNNAHCTHKKVG
eukprot:CAMPEP_0114241566 /NCGR_PEP_ID=MMETSP0058-20121206/9698_1 /TAXON_ID=36894 /ORGANISM="Pyramimonas parkeae, CCMP726" /LENGTH=452 /DNA_ID=CAMNT_0001354095 /DNA_START=138 /DNA_END=1496 /DNA_ORIENTATION=-